MSILKWKRSPKKYFLNHIKHKNAVGVHSTCFLLLFFVLKNIFFFGKRRAQSDSQGTTEIPFADIKANKELKNVFHIIGLLVRISVHIYIKIVVISFWFFYAAQKKTKDRRSKGQHKCIFMLILLKLVLSTWWWSWRWCVYA